MGYSKKSGVKMSGSPLAKYGCGGKKAAFKMAGGVEEVNTKSFTEEPLDPAKTTTGENKPYTGVMTFKSKGKGAKYGIGKGGTQKKRKI